MNMGIIFAEAIASVIDAVVLVGFLTIVLGWKTNKRRSIGIVTGVILMLISYHLSEYMILQTVLLVAILFCYARGCLKGTWGKQLLLCCICCIVSIVIAIILIQLVAIALRCANLELTVMAGTPRIIYLCINRLIYVFVFYIILNLYSPNYNLRKNEWELAGVSFLSAVAISLVLLFWTSNGTFTVYEQIYACFIAIAVIISTVVSMLMVSKLSKQNETELKNQALEMQIDKERNMITNLDREFTKIKIMRHDMNKQLNIYLQLLKNGNVEEAVKTLSQQIDENISEYIYIKDNHLVGAVLSEKKELCQKNHIQFDYTVGTVADEEKEMDIAILLANLLDNAIEAEQHVVENRNISIQIFEMKSMYNIIVKNHIEESVLSKNPGLLTNKTNKDIHGLGLRSVRDTVEKYDGMYQYFEDGGTFTVHIMVTN